MTIKQINWKQAKNKNMLLGYIDDLIVVEIVFDHTGKKSTVYRWMLCFNDWTNNKTRKGGTHKSVDLAKKAAQREFEKFIKLCII